MSLPFFLIRGEDPNMLFVPPCEITISMSDTIALTILWDPLGFSFALSGKIGLIKFWSIL